MPFGFGEAIDAVRAQVRETTSGNVNAVQESFWRRVVDTQLGVAAFDPVGHKIGFNVAYKSGEGLNWYPADRYKQTLVGQIDRYGFYNPSGGGDEADWNIYIKPDPAFAFLIDDVLSNADLEEVHTCDNLGGYCMEAEITPDESFYNNPYFNADGSSNRIGQRIGVYGPWVMEEDHGWRPEIHPSEVLWWRTSGGGQSPRYTWTVLVVQDDSNRFDRSSNYRGRITRPWSAVPRAAVIDIALNISPARTKRLEVRDLYHRNVLISDPAGAQTVSSVFGGQTVATLDKSRLTNATYVRAEFGAMRSADRGTALHGFLRLRVSVGRNDRGGEGYIVLEIRETAG